MADENNTGGRGRPSTKPIEDRVFEAWEAAYKATERVKPHVAKLAKISSGLTKAQVETVQARKKEYLENPNAVSVEGTIEV